MIARDDRSDFVACSAGAGGVSDASRWSNDELISGQNQFSGRARLRFRIGQRNEPFAALMFPIESFIRLQGQHRAPAFGRGNERRIFALRQTDMKETGTPKQSPGFIAALGFFEIKDFALTAAVVSESGILAQEHHAQDRLMFAGGNFVALAQDGNAILAIGRIAHGMLVRTEMDRRPKFQPRKFVAGLQLVADMNRVLPVQEQESLFDNNAVHLESPGGQAVL